ncbi:MAG: Rod shape-determining protein RodA [Candidatus Ordinivivax streblomastigis]|uniref:Cell wall polymerase n=1 Tax=Candidatus Ordinivivax streblomastigis TaxID=2540710 RepID=A0A5M8NUQ7_9BACT|nr:MAG: Rod shape-determining protein RodA [Candidatus Ordinivivax streblomastigis]
MGSRNINLWQTVDWMTIGIYLVLVICGWLSICGASSYDYLERDFWDFSTRAGKQLIWIACSFGIGFVLLMLEDRFYEMFSYIVYGILLTLLIVTFFVATDIKGSRSWLQFGILNFQPAEFAKFATALALAKYMSAYAFDMVKLKSVMTVLMLIMAPMILIVMQKETGSALVYFAFFLVLYREGMPGSILFTGVCVVCYFVIGTRFNQVYMSDGLTSIGEFVIFSIILFSVGAMMWVYVRKRTMFYYIVGISFSVLLLSYLVSSNFIPFDIVWVQWGLCGLTVGYLVFLSIKERILAYISIALFAIGSIGFLYSSDYVFNHILSPHQQVRIKVSLGMEEDLAGAGYNVNQSKIAIGSGGLTGKGFLNGTQTKLKYVPEQDTDFIFCTIGEEQGFRGSAVILFLYLALILRLIVLAERQRAVFGRVYGYSVMSIYFFHLLINIGMVLGLTPVIGIPLPFFSYGGSSLVGFTILLFIFLKIDAMRSQRL